MALWCAAHNVLIQQLTNRYGQCAIKGLFVLYSAQVLLFWLMRGKIMCTDINALACCLCMNRTPAVKDNTFIFRTAHCCCCCMGRMGAVKNDPLINNNNTKATSPEAERCGRRRQRKLEHLCDYRPRDEQAADYSSTTSQTDWGAATKDPAKRHYYLFQHTIQNAKHSGYTDKAK